MTPFSTITAQTPSNSAQASPLSDLSLETVNEKDGTTWNITIRGENNHNDLITIDHQYAGIHTDAQGKKIPSVSEFRFDEGTFNIDQLMHILG